MVDWLRNEALVLLTSILEAMPWNPAVAATFLLWNLPFGDAYAIYTPDA
jgi:hypothetical protein